jgi:dethiobiotin synthetase
MGVYKEISSVHDITIVEGAGGLLVPLLPSYTYADLAKVLRFPLIVVGANKLGMINHLLLTLEHSSCKGLSVLGYVLNQIDNQPSLAAQTNREALASLTGVPCLGELPHLQEVKTGATASADWLDGRLELRLFGSVLNHDKR